MQEYIACFIYTTITLLLPLKQTYQAVNGKNEKSVALWTNYWAIYCVLKFIQSYIGFLTYQPFEFISMLFLLWCYHSDYKGALLLSSLVRENIKKNQHIANVINMIHEKLKFLNLFEGETAIEAQKQKTN